MLTQLVAYPLYERAPGCLIQPGARCRRVISDRFADWIHRFMAVSPDAGHYEREVREGRAGRFHRPAGRAAGHAKDPSGMGFSIPEGQNPCRKQLRHGLLDARPPKPMPQTAAAWVAAIWEEQAKWQIGQAPPSRAVKARASTRKSFCGWKSTRRTFHGRRNGLIGTRRSLYGWKSTRKTFCGYRPPRDCGGTEVPDHWDKSVRVAGQQTPPEWLTNLRGRFTRDPRPQGRRREGP